MSGSITGGYVLTLQGSRRLLIVLISAVFAFYGMKMLVPPRPDIMQGFTGDKSSQYMATRIPLRRPFAQHLTSLPPIPKKLGLPRFVVRRRPSKRRRPAIKRGRAAETPTSTTPASNVDHLGYDDEKKITQRLPQVINIGVKKCGTATMKIFLKANPHLAVHFGETQFFSMKYYRGLSFYRSKMEYSRPSQITIEGTPRYFIIPEVPKRIWNMNSSIQLIVIVRDPVQRLISDYAHHDNLGKNSLKKKSRENSREEPCRGRLKLYKELSEDRVKEMDDNFPNVGDIPPFDWLVFGKNGQVDTSLRMTSASLYDVHLGRFLKYFNLSQIHVVDSKNLQERPWDELAKVERFLGIPSVMTEDTFVRNPAKPAFFCQLVHKERRCLPPGKGRAHPVVSNETLWRLREFYRPHNEAFFKMIGRRFPWL